MNADISKVAVIGAGTMGAGIAGLCAAKGCDVVLLDVDAAAPGTAIERLQAGKRPVITAEHAAKITPGSIDDDLAKVADCDWICEAIVENLEIKRDLFERLEQIRADGSILSTNTSGIPLRDIYAGMPQRLQQDIAVTHFFNPVHIMKLVELVPGTQTSDRAMQRLNVFLADDLAKGVVNAKDTVNFIGNRIGCFWMLAGLHKAADADISMETVDALMAKPIGLPPTGLYGLIDLIGLDVMDLVAKNLAANLPATDAGMAFASLPATEAAMHANGQLGRKTGGGFYKMTRTEDGGKSMETFDLAAKSWRPMAPATLDEVHQNIETMLFADDAEGRFAWDLMSATLAYSSALIPEISDDIVNVDRAMKWGFNWAQGPFELLDSIGPARFAEKLAASGGTVDGMLKVLTDNGHSSFYRNDGSEFLTLDGSYAKV
jgi:3-hydroxyacyl-CoA dehydrogenase